MIELTSFPEEIYLSSFGYVLPEEKIARFPLEHRDQSKLIIWKSNKIEEGIYSDIAQYLPSPSLLVFNNSRVIEARILFQKSTGGQIEIFCLEPPSHMPVAEAMIQTGSAEWICLIGGASKWKRSQVLIKESGSTTLAVHFVEKRKDDFLVRFSWTPANLSFASVLHQMGSIPLPPYLKRAPEIADNERYQTVFASESGSVAAPTAGLHFSESLIERLSKKKIEPLYMTLHVGAGTFMPVKADKLSEHHMHEEFIEVTTSAIETLIQKISEPVIAVGTTSLRTLETLYWLGLKVSRNKNISCEELVLEQEYPYREPADITPADALFLLLEWMKKKKDKKLVTRTQLFIVPGYKFKMVQGLVTNFHQPHSTLLLLVSAFIGTVWKNIYQYALENNYRFLSYGDGCLFLPAE